MTGRPSRWDRWCQQLELSQGEALKLWSEKRQQGWQTCPPQWALPCERQTRDDVPASKME